MLTFRITCQRHNPGYEVGGKYPSLHSPLPDVSALDQSDQTRVGTIKTGEPALEVFLIMPVILTLGTIALRQFGLANRIWPVQPFLMTLGFMAAFATRVRLILSRVAAIETSSLADSV